MTPETVRVVKGVFGADMQIEASLDGPFNIVFRTEDVGAGNV